MKVFQLQDEWTIDHLTLTERPDPAPGPGQVLLQMKAASLNFRDSLVVQRGYGSMTGELPLIPLSDGVGTVLAVGEGVTRVGVGDRVCPTFIQVWISGPPSGARGPALGGPLDGVMAEKMVLSEEGVVALPDHLSDAEAATLPCAALTAWSSLVTRGGIKSGQSVLVQGTGGVALFALQFAKLAGARVMIISSSDEKLERAKELGADLGVNYKTTPDWWKPGLEFSGGAGIDHILELGGTDTMSQSTRCILRGGRINIIGVLSGDRVDLRLGAAIARSIRFEGISVGSRNGMEAMIRAIGQHGLRPVVDTVFPFDDLRQALDHMTSGAHFGKVCLEH
ncbi:MAG: NAD(P)-dependent alcohol dehydrogenase [Alphaproteobacteria bacterium]|jgi:NADPH:quinone reductase-like Zn-dependent oxidoreductase|nr:NAD(P)-dependent alcohol dehydrogenase [Rhodospirillaceae bacterium]MDP6404900.1 NAD(P)-dependent alcohol dehydrogenase [Alphaproteobacteria bacterium]MDP6621568.1 NAD(P)-dependent alcohol dehydrogenase [Alphaproteobacteria bacterium]|tara:strand:- start:1280 stop:2290 length:1011 start_codon:yes stop_codon:yes gene_type:complete